MKLTFDQIKSITAGAVRITEEDGAVRFYRFSEKQTELYKTVRKDFYDKTFSTSGIKLKFKTNSNTLSLTVFAKASSSRSFFDHDICVNGELKYTLSGNLKDGEEISPKTVSGRYYLGEGEKTVCIYFPWSVDSRILSLELDDGATVIPVPYSCRMLTFGDSITHGYDAENPSKSYASILADYFDADAVNKGIGGEVFRPDLCAIKEDFTPDIITVAYGTNDWSITDKETFDKNSEKFYTTLARLYPNAKIISLAPIVRLDYNRETKVGTFDYIAKKFNEIAKKIPNMIVVDCFPFLPKEKEMFLDLRLHPNNVGFSYYAKGIIAELEK
jgi:lysophospholipase L1-like esterase